MGIIINWGSSNIDHLFYGFTELKFLESGIFSIITSLDTNTDCNAFTLLYVPNTGSDIIQFVDFIPTHYMSDRNT